MISTTQLDIDGARLAVHSSGEGRLAILVHGFPLDHRMWLQQLPALSSPERRVAAVDLRGHGHSPWAGDEVHRMELLADDVAQVIAALGGGEPADLVGLSMGGYVVLALYDRHPELFRSLALVDTRATPDTEEAKAARDATAQNLVEAGAAWLVDRMMPALLAPDASLLSKARVRSMIESQPIESLVADLRGMRDRPDRSLILPQIQVPVLVVVGEHDAITPPEEAREMAEAMEGSRLEVIGGAGHLSPMEAPGAFDQVLADFWTTA